MFKNGSKVEKIKNATTKGMQMSLAILSAVALAKNVKMIKQILLILSLLCDT